MDFVVGLFLIRHDPDLLTQSLLVAQLGNADPQYVAGLIYVEGHGLAIALIEAYPWLNLAWA